MKKKQFTAWMMAIAMGTTLASSAVYAEETDAILTEESSAAASDSTQSADTQDIEQHEIELSDASITVDGAAISTDSSEAVYTGAEIIYYKEGQDSTYGEGKESDAHSAEEAAGHTVLTITRPGTYRITGTLSRGQIAIDLGEDATEDETAVVNLILDNAEITCTVAPAIVVYSAYECGSDDAETATKDVDTSAAGFNLILADSSTNTVNGSYVAKIFKEGTTQEEVDAGEAKKAYKFDAAIDSKVSFNINGESDGSGKLIVNSDNEGIESSLHMTINGGEITINSADDAINTNEDYVSVLTINGGIVTCDSGLGHEGDGIDSNGWIVMNGGFVIASANAQSQDSGVDSDLGIYLNGGTLLASGNMYDEISGDSEQTFLVLNFTDKISEGQQILLKDSEGNPVTAFHAVNDFSILVYSSDLLTEGEYSLYLADSVIGTESGSIVTDITEVSGETQLQYSGTNMMGGFGGFGGFPGGMPDGERPEMPEGMEEGERPEMPEGMEEGERPEMPEGMEEGERPEMPEGMEEGERPEMPEGMPEGELPEMPEGMPEGEMPEMPQNMMAGDSNQEPSTVFSIQQGQNFFSQIAAAESEE